MKKLISLLVCLFSLSILTNCGGGSTPAPVPPQILHRITSTTEEVSIASRKMVEGKDYIGTVTVNAGIPKTLSDLEYVHVGDSLDDIKDKCTFNIVESSLDKEAKLTIPKEYVTDNIKFSVTLGDSVTHNISIDKTSIKPPSEQNFISIEPETVYEGTDYTGTITYNNPQSGIPYTLPSVLSSVKVDDGDDVDFKDACDYKVIDSHQRKATITIPGEYINNNIYVKLELSTCKSHKVYSSVEGLSVLTATAYDNINYDSWVKVNDDVPDLIISVPDNDNRVYAYKGSDRIDITKECSFLSHTNKEAMVNISGFCITSDIDDIEVVMATKTLTPDFTITINPTEATIEPSGIFQGQEYTGTITVAKGYALPCSPLDKGSILLNDGSQDIDITEECSYEPSIRRDTATITIPEGDTYGDISVNLELEEKPNPSWYEYEDWWNYCSNGQEGVQAVEGDVGMEVNVTVTAFAAEPVTHKVRLIGVDHDNLADGTGKAHCTFEFVDVVTTYENDPEEFPWNSLDFRECSYEENNFDYRFSLIEDFLNDDTGEYIDDRMSVIEYLPSDLQSKIKIVNKSVAVNESKQEGEENYEVKTYNPQRDRCPRLFLLSLTEMGLSSDMVEGEEYEYYKKPSATYVKTISGDEKRIAERYWLRSPYIHSTNQAQIIYNEDANVADVNNNHTYIAPAFCI